MTGGGRLRFSGIRRRWFGHGASRRRPCETLQLLSHLIGQLLFCGQVQLVLRGKNLAIVFRQRVAHHDVVFVGAKQHADGRFFKVGLHVAVVVVDVHLELPQILVRDFVNFDVEQDEALQQPIVEHALRIWCGSVGSASPLAMANTVSLS